MGSVEDSTDRTKKPKMNTFSAALLLTAGLVSSAPGGGYYKGYGRSQPSKNVFNTLASDPQFSTLVAATTKATAAANPPRTCSTLSPPTPSSPPWWLLLQRLRPQPTLQERVQHSRLRPPVLHPGGCRHRRRAHREGHLRPRTSHYLRSNQRRLRQDPRGHPERPAGRCPRPHRDPPQTRRARQGGEALLQLPERGQCRRKSAHHQRIQRGLHRRQCQRDRQVRGQRRESVRHQHRHLNCQ